MPASMNMAEVKTLDGSQHSPAHTVQHPAARLTCLSGGDTGMLSAENSWAHSQSRESVPSVAAAATVPPLTLKLVRDIYRHHCLFCRRSCT